MGKKIQLAQNKDDLHDLGPDDLLSQLSDDILVSVLSYLPLNFAAATSMLSRRWRHLWCQTVRLEFENKERSKKIRSHVGGLKEYADLVFAERNKYINWVNRIIRQHKSPNIDEFKICFYLDVISKGAIDKWIEFAVSKNVQRLELDLDNDFDFDTKGNYAFPNKIFDRKYESSPKQSSFNVPAGMPYATVMEIKFLKSLILKSVDVNDEGLRKILSNCPVLEHLSIHDSNKLVKAKIHGKWLALKTLEIIHCFGLESIEICDSNIVSFNCKGFDNEDSPISFRLDNLQKLEKISIYVSEMKISRMSSQIFCSIPYFPVSELGFYLSQEDMQFFTFPTLPKLKRLKVEVGLLYDDSYSVLTSFVEAYPNLQRFTVQLGWKTSTCGLTNRQATKQPHLHLEVVEIDDYHGYTSDLDFVMYFIQNCVAPKKLVIKPEMDEVILAPNEITEVKNAARYRARQQFEPKIPVGVELVIL